jgi:chromosome segregation ATPase
MPSDERTQIEAAMGRLLDGAPLRSDGKLTIVSLAIEADVKRHVLTHKHTDLKDRFYARAQAQDSIPASETALQEQITDLRRKLDDVRGERDEYRLAAQALARALNVLMIENETLRGQANRLVTTGRADAVDLGDVTTASGDHHLTAG